MSEPKQQPKILLRKPKKSQRSPSGVSQSTDPVGDVAGSARSVSTASSTSPPNPPGPKQPIWYRFRTALTTLLVLNAVVVGYTLFRTNSKPSEVSEEAQSVEERATEEKDEERPKDLEIEKESEIGKEKAETVDIKREVLEPSEVTPAAVIPQAISLEGISKPKVSSEDQQELFKWVLAEKRKVKPTSKAEKAQIDAEKALLKEYLRSKSVLNFRGV